MLALYYYQQLKEEVLILVPNETLRKQLAEQVGPICPGGAKIRTMKEFYQYSLEAPVIIIDEFDDLLNSYPYDL
jgi:hypothetical protein